MEQQMSGIHYLDGRVAIVDNLDGFAPRPNVDRPSAFAILLCLKGNSSMYIDGTLYDMAENDLFICRPHLVVEDSKISDDFEFRGIGISPDYAEQLSLLSANSWDAKVFMENNPILHLEPEDVTLFCQYYDLLKSKALGKPIFFQRQLVESLLTAFMCEFHEVMVKFGDSRPQSFSSAENIFKKFITLLEQSFPKKRSVAFYADQLCVTPKYLSAISKEVSGHTASYIIHKYVVKDLRMMLARPEKSIKEICNELEFPNISFFGKYVKQHLGKSPRRWREGL